MKCGKLFTEKRKERRRMQGCANAWLKVNLNTMQQNAEICAQSTGRIIPVLKADAYGLGLVPVAKALASLPTVACIAVAQVQEGLALREAGIFADILVLGEALPAQAEAAVRNGLTLIIGRSSDVLAIESTAERLHTTASVQLKVDTGLHRLGLRKEEIPSVVSALHKAKHLSVRGAYSHFADTEDAALCETQYEAFLDACDYFTAEGIPIPLRHICDSAASERYPQYALDAVRLGRRLAWDAPQGGGTIRESTTLQAYVLDVRTRKAGERLGYGAGTVLTRDAEIAVLGIGYGDGLDPRMAEYRLPVLLHGQRCPMQVCFMDQTLIDVTGLGVVPGDVATVFGYDESGVFLSAQEKATACGANEGCAFTTALLPRVERIYA